MALKDILEEAGGFGLYQKCLTFGYLSLSLILASFSGWSQIFILLTPSYRCKNVDNDTQWIQTDIESGNQKADSCSIENDTCNNGFVYDFTTTFPTYTSENDLVCDDAWKMYFVHTVYWIGAGFGTIVFGFFNDKYGRKRAYQVAISLTLAGDVVTYFCSHHIIFLMARFFSAAGAGIVPTITFILVIENSLPNKRRLTIFVWSFAFALASLSIVWLMYLVYNWRYLLIVVWIPSSTGLLLSFFLSESPSWLMAKGRIDEAVANIERMARINGKTLTKDFILGHLQKSNETDGESLEKIKTISKSVEKTNSVIETVNKKEMSSFQALKAVLKSPNLRKRILCLACLWMASSSCYNGNNLALPNLPFSMYITYSIGAVVELPGCLFVMATLDKLGRRWVNAGSFILGGSLGILSANIKSKTLILILAMFMRLFYSCAFDITFSISSELIPTEIRGRTVSFIRTCGGIGGAIAPFIVSLAEKDPLLPFSCFGLVAILAGLLMLTLPETAHQHLPQTIEEGENFGTDQSFWYCPFFRNKHIEENKEKNPRESFESHTNEIEKIRSPCVGLSIHKLQTD